ncbi:imelysin family protein [Photobacterium leiognathi]|uniref:imelysin family protein n=1 Tax=Photobacterium leiognathi TaxID=553611 RepID=UPI0029826DD2|nr:imelysin family protein [Photobacterium leiognathi]
MMMYTKSFLNSSLFCGVALGVATLLTGCGEANNDKLLTQFASVADNHVHPVQTGFNLAPVHEMSVNAAKGYVLSSYLLDEQIGKLCKRYSEETLQAAQQAWLQSMHSWMKFQGREKGSEEALALGWKVQFWPDKKNTTGRKIKQLLQVETLPTSQGIADQSVAVQGLGAVEWFLFQEQKQLADPKYCQLAHAITGNMLTTAKALEMAWEENPWQDLTPQLALAEYLGALNNQLDYTLKKLTRPMGKPGQPKPYQAEAWRSQTSMLSLKASVEALHQLYLANGKGLNHLLIESGHEVTANRINQRFELLLEDWPKQNSMVAMMKTKEGYRDLINVFNGLEYIQIALHDDVATELGIVMGFNATDGD